MLLWRQWWRWAAPLRPACARSRTFMWMLVVLAGFCVREDLLGVTSFVRVLGLQALCYDRILDFFHSPALDLGTLTRTWAAWVLSAHPGLVRFNGRIVLVADGISVPKAGTKMPAVKRLHQQSESNNKPEFIMGHSCQAVAVRRKMDAYHRFMQLGLIAQGIMVALATTAPELVWRHFGSWLRTVRPGICPSEMVVAIALRNSLPEFLADDSCDPNFAKFLRDRIDLETAKGMRMAA